MLVVDSWEEEQVPDILKACSVFDSPKHVERNTVCEESPEVQPGSNVVVNVICIVST